MTVMTSDPVAVPTVARPMSNVRPPAGGIGIYRSQKLAQTGYGQRSGEAPVKPTIA
jgi:hypothetical protein